MHQPFIPVLSPPAEREGKPGPVPVAAERRRWLPIARSEPAAMLTCIAAITIVRLVWLAMSPADLYPDEAQYWLWAKHLAFGYYSKPPLLPWLIALTTGLFGDGEFAVRLSSPLLHAGTAIFIYAIGADLYDPPTGFWSALCYATLPGTSVSSFIASTDAPLMLCWAVALYAFIRARETDRWRWWTVAGIAAGFGLLAKYAMAYWVLSALGFILSARAERRHLPGVLTSLAIALTVYSPNLWWNWGTGFVSYLHTRDNAYLCGGLFHPVQLVEFFGSQFGVFGPLCFGALIALALRPRLLAEPRARLLAVFALPTLATMLILSLLSRAEPNWAAPAYVSATVLVVAWALGQGWRKLVAFSIVFNLAAAVALFTGYQTLTALGVGLPERYDPLHRLRGWRALGEQVGAELARHPGFTLFADDRELVAALIYYVRPHPFDAVKWDLLARVKDQWDLTNDMRKRTGDDFLLVSRIPNLPDEMRPSFGALKPLHPLAIRVGPGETRVYGVYLAYGFKGYPQYRQ
jgi:Dolichyl-phosphate-mannose-protein mannosyltransferase